MTTLYYTPIDLNLHITLENIDLKHSSYYVPLSLSFGIFTLIIVTAYCIMKYRKKRKIKSAMVENKQGNIDNVVIENIKKANKIDNYTEHKRSSCNRSNGYKDDIVINKKVVFDSSVNFFPHTKLITKHTLASTNTSQLNMKQTSKNEPKIIKQNKTSLATITSIRSKDIINKIVDDTIREEKKNNIILEKRYKKRTNISVDSNLNNGFVNNSWRDSIQENDDLEKNLESKTNIISTHFLNKVTNYKEITYQDAIKSHRNEIRISID